MSVYVHSIMKPMCAYGYDCQSRVNAVLASSRGHKCFEVCPFCEPTVPIALVSHGLYLTDVHVYKISNEVRNQSVS